MAARPPVQAGSFGGTSAATPIVSGVVALVREANNALTWRDVKLILAASARKVDPNTGWVEGAFKYGSTTDRYNFNHEYGFGMVDAKAAVDLAVGWTNVRDLREITSESSVINLRIPDLPWSGTPTTVSSSLTIDPFVEFVEFVEVNAHFNHPFFRDLTVELVSPSGAVSTQSPSAPIDGALTNKFRFGSARHLGEDSAGEWTLRIKDARRGSTGNLRSWGLTIYGHGSIPGAPDIDTVTPGGGTLEIDWKAPTDTGETAITSYDLRYIREDATDKSDDEWALETGVGTPNNRSYTITELIGGVKYEFQLRAHNDAGHGPWSEAVGDEPTTVAPSAPAITSITRGDRTLAVVWTAPADTGGGGITAYDVRYIETSEDETVESNWTVRDNAWRSGDLRYVISSLTNATEYDVQVRAVNSAGDGEWSGTETGTPLPDDIPITLEWEATSFEVAEDAGSVVLRAVFTTTLDAPPEADFTFDVTLTTTDRGTTPGDDYTAPSSSATFDASDFSQTDVNGQQRYRATRDFTVTIFDDTADESNESFRVRLAYLTPGLPHLQGGPSTAVVTIQDNEHVPVTLSWEHSDMMVSENTGNATLRAYAVTTVDKRPEDGFSFDASIETSNGSAAQPGDYTQVDDTVTFSRTDFSRVTVNGERRYRAEKRVQVAIVDDMEDEPDEDFHATLAYAGPILPHLQGGPASTTVSITDNDFVPVFPGTTTERSIREDTPAGRNVGAPVTATDANKDRLTYTISASDAFEIVDSTGQIRTKVELDHEEQDTHTIRVTATDPGGLFATVSVTNTVEDVDETPVVTGETALEFPEDTDTSTVLATYSATDPDRKGINWELTGTDGEDFTLSVGGVLIFNAVPDFEEPADSNRDNRYQLTIEAREQGDGTSVGRLSATVRVTNVDEPGMVETNAVEPRVGQTVRLNVEDEDGGESVSEWQWERGVPNSPCGTVENPTVTSWEPIPGATSSSYTPTASDQGYCIMVTAIYNDRAGTGRSEAFLTTETVEVGPFFDSDTATASADENEDEGHNIRQFRARHSNSGETLTYSLTGGDIGFFMVDEATSQLRTSATPVDYESLTDHEAEVEITATDNNGQSATITVTITVTDECASAGEPPCAPGRPGVSAASDTSLRVTWSTPRTPSGTSITGYDLQYRESSTDDSWASESVSGTNRSHTIENLIKGTTYEVQVRAMNDNSGFGALSQSGTGTPGHVPPPPPPPPPPKATTTTGGGGGGGGGGGFAAAPAAPVLLPRASVSPRILSFTAYAGAEDPPAQLLGLWSPVSRPMSFNVSGNASWLSVAPASGVSAGPGNRLSLTVSVDASELSQGSHRAL